MKQRYTTSFKSENTRCFWVDDNPGFVPIIDNDVVCVALCDNKTIAEKIVALLNAAEMED